MKEAFLEGFISGSSVVLFLLLAILLYFVPARWIRGRSQSSVSGPVENPLPDRSGGLVKSAKSCCILVSGAVFVLAIFYLYVTGLHQYDGIVRDKVTDTLGSEQTRALYFVMIMDTKYQIDESLYVVVNEGDRLRKPLLRPWVYVNERRVFLEDVFRNSGFWLGVIGSACALICLWSLASAVIAPQRHSAL